ncbi:hypothetical protein [Terracidiphilus sp.]|uniref:hypothetical protein n=1 Tax=Terracidiphilus sp. TaxID=1964191 RepID=UPI003C1D41CE
MTDRQDITNPRRKPDVSSIFNLGNSGGTDIARDKDAMIAAAVDSRYSFEHEISHPSSAASVDAHALDSGKRDR